MTPRLLAWRTVASNPARAALAVAGVAVIGALLFDMLMLSRGLLISFSNLITASDFDVRVGAGPGLPGMRQPLDHAKDALASIARLPEVRDVAAIRISQGDALVTHRPDTGVSIVAITAGAERQTYRLLSGAPLPAGPTDAAAPPSIVSQSLARALNLTIGSTFRLRPAARGEASAVPGHEFRVVGIANFLFRPSDDDTVAITMADATRVALPGEEDSVDLIVAASRAPFGPEDAAAAIQHLRPDLHASSNADVIAEFNQNGFAYFRQVSLVLSSITFAFAVLLTATLLTMSANQRLSEMAALRALGFARRRIVWTLVWESAWLVGAGGILSIPIGLILARILDRILLAMPGLPAGVHFFIAEPRAIALHAGALVLTTLAAAAYPVWIAIRLPIADTLRRETI